MADKAEYKKRLVRIEELPPADDLVAGNRIDWSTVKLNSEGEYRRGELMMSGEGGNFVPATLEGLNAAAEVCILATNVTLGAEEFCECDAYFGGEFRASRVILPFEEAEVNHEDFLRQITPRLRQQKIFIR